MSGLTRASALLLCGLLGACASQRNYPAEAGPRYVGEPPPHIQARAPSDTLRVVSFNIEYALQVDSALKVLTTEPQLRNADVILLQEMDATTTRYIARELGMWFVYYPAALHIVHNRDFGNAILSRYPIISDSKIVLPHAARVLGTVRSATAATIRVGNSPVRVYSVHLGTMVNVTPGQRADQLRAVLADAVLHPRVIIGGDMNDATIGKLAREAGYLWPTEEGPRTAAIGRLDHIFLRGLFVPDGEATGTVLGVRNASDHRPIWLTVLLRR